MSRPTRADFIRDLAAECVVAIVGSNSVIESSDNSGTIAVRYATTTADALPAECFALDAHEARGVVRELRELREGIARRDQEIARLREALRVALKRAADECRAVSVRASTTTGSRVADACAAAIDDMIRKEAAKP